MTEDRRIVIEWLSEVLRPESTESIADVGCGKWEWPEEFLKRSITKFDYRKIPGIVQWNIEAPPSSRWVGQFDWVMLTQVLEHVFRPIEAVKNVLSLSCKHLLISAPFIYPLHGEPDIYRFTKTFFERVFSECKGLAKVETKYLGGTQDLPKQVVVHVIKS